MKKYILAVPAFILVLMCICMPAYAAVNYASNAEVSFKSSDGKRDLDANSGIYFASYAIDNDTSTFAIAGGEYAWSLLIDMKEPKENVGEVAITFADDTYIAPSYDVLVSLDGNNWDKVATVANNTDGQRRVHSFDPQTVRYVRIVDTMPRNSKSMRLAEVEIYPIEGKGAVAKLNSPKPESYIVDVNGDIVIRMSVKLSEKYVYKARLIDAETKKEILCKKMLNDTGYMLTLKPYIRLDRNKKYIVSFDNQSEDFFVTCENDPMKNVKVNRYGKLSLVSTTDKSIIVQNMRAVDGDLSTSVGADTTGQYFGDEAMVLELDFRRVYNNISRINIDFSNQNVSMFYIKASKDGINWTDVEKIYTHGQKSFTIDKDPFSARYVRVYTGEGKMDIAEISVKCAGLINDFNAQVHTSQDPNGVTKISFEHQVEPKSINDESVYILQGDKKVDCTYSLNDVGNELTIDYKKGLDYNSDYIVVLTDNIKDSRNNSLTAQTVNFRTKQETQFNILTVSSDEYMTDKDNAIYPAFVDNLVYQAWTREGSTDYYQIKLEGGCKPFKFEIEQGKLPEGLSLSEDGKIAGTPIKEETTSFTVKVTDSKGKTATKNLSMTANPYRAKWFADAKFGLMTQWGPNSLTFAEYKYDGYSQAWNGTQKQIEYFEKMYKGRFNAKQWVDEVEKSGAKVFNYMVCAGNGLRLYPSEVESTVNAKLNMDMIGELIEECHKRDIKFIGYMAPENSWADKFNDKDIETQSVSKLRVNVLCELLEMGMDGVWMDAGWLGYLVDWDLLIASMRTVNPYATLQSNPSVTAFGWTPMYPHIDIQTVECTNLDNTDKALHVAYHSAVRKKMAVEQTGLLGSRWLGHTPVKSVDGVINNIKENWKNGVTYMLVTGPDQYGNNFIDPQMRPQYNEITAWVKENINSQEYTYKERDNTPSKIGKEKLITDVSVINKSDVVQEKNSILTGMEIMVGKYPVELTSIGRMSTGTDGKMHHFAIYKSGNDGPYLLSGDMNTAQTAKDANGFMYYDFAPVRLEAYGTYTILCEEDATTNHYVGNIKSIDNEYVKIRNGIFTDISWTKRYNSSMFYPNEHQLLDLKFDVLYDEVSLDSLNVARMANVELRDNEDNVKGPSGENSFATNAIDGDYNTKAAAAYAYAWTLWVDLEKEYDDINNIKLTFGAPNGFATEFEIYASTDNVNWEKITYVNENEALQHNFTYKPFKARYFKVRSLKPDARGQKGGQMAIYEFEVYTAGN